MGLKVVRNSAGIALTAATAQDSPIAAFLDRYGEGVQCVAIRVGDLDKAVAHWQGCGIRVIGRSEYKGERAVQFHPKDTCGVLIELVG
jgi:methylmalonyl-CoA/ethylmalonyl-CoA epimerase